MALGGGVSDSDLFLAILIELMIRNELYVMVERLPDDLKAKRADYLAVLSNYATTGGLPPALQNKDG